MTPQQQSNAAHTSPLLTDEEPLQVLPSLAVRVGLNEAIILQQLHYWLRNKKSGEVIGGVKWIFNSFDEWVEQFPFLSKRTVERSFAKLEAMRIVLSEQFGGRDRRNYWRIDYDALNALLNPTSDPDPDTHTQSPCPPPADENVSRQSGAMHDDNLALSDPPEWRDASRQSGGMEDARLSRPSRQDGGMLNKVSEISSETSQRLHTHGARDPAPAAGVRVSASKFSFDVRDRYAGANNLGPGWLQLSSDGRYDEVIAATLERGSPERVAEERARPVVERKTFGEWAQMLSSLVEMTPGYDVAGFIDRMEAGEDVRARLREKFLAQPAGRAG